MILKLEADADSWLSIPKPLVETVMRFTWAWRNGTTTAGGILGAIGEILLNGNGSKYAVSELILNPVIRPVRQLRYSLTFLPIFYRTPLGNLHREIPNRSIQVSIFWRNAIWNVYRSCWAFFWFSRVLRDAEGCQMNLATGVANLLLLRMQRPASMEMPMSVRSAVAPVCSAAIRKRQSTMKTCLAGLSLFAMIVMTKLVHIQTNHAY